MVWRMVFQRWGISAFAVLTPCVRALPSGAKAKPAPPLGSTSDKVGNDELGDIVMAALTDQLASDLLNSRPEGNPIPGVTTAAAVARISLAAPRLFGATVEFNF